MSLSNTTIIAPASGTTRAGVIVIRVSGPNAGSLISLLTKKNIPASRKAVLRNVFDLNDEIIDNALVIFFPGPNSFTGEDIAEFHIHGSRAVLNRFIQNALDSGLCQMAEAGEFTRRAFENSKMDLSSAEGLADLIDAETEAQRKQALRQMNGELGALAQSWRSELIDIIAHLEAYIDFPDEDLPDGLRDISSKQLSNLISRLDSHIRDSRFAQRIRDGFYVAIIGAPNTGKSSLLNALSRKDAAIVSPIAGTTRDIIETSIVISGQLFWLCDTAGLRDAADEIEIIGIERALKRADTADLRIGLVSNIDQLKDVEPYLLPSDLLVLTKIDIQNENDDKLWAKVEEVAKNKALSSLKISSKTGEGLHDLENALASLAIDANNSLEGAPITRARHEEALKKSISALSNVNFDSDTPPELIVEDLRLAARYLGAITGSIGVEDVLDKIFSSFCIGK